MGATIGRAAPVRAWRRYDVFGDTEAIAVTFSYCEREHVLLVRTDLCRPAVATEILIDSKRSDIPGLMQDVSDPLIRWNELDLADARSRLEPALGRCDRGRRPSLPEKSMAFLPVARSRLRRLPRPQPAGPQARFEAGDRQAAVAGFLADPAARDAGSAEPVRFWAEALSGYGALVPEAPPTQVGPIRLAHVLLGYIPTMFELTEQQRAGMSAGVTAWVRWAAARHHLDEVARDRIEATLPKVLATFQDAYDDPDQVRQRAYVRDVSATTTDGDTLAAVLARRSIAVPDPDTRTGSGARRIVDVADPADRRAVIQDEYGDCEPPKGTSGADFLAAAARVSEQLWRDDPPQLWQTARRLLAKGSTQHEIIHELVQADVGG